LIVERAARDAGDRDLVDHAVTARRRHRPGGGERLALDLPDPLGGEARTFRRLADRDHLVEGEEDVGDLLDLGGGCARGELVGDRLDRVAAVEVRGAGGERVGKIGGRDPRRRRFPPGIEGLPDGLSVEADRLGPRAPALPQALLREVPVLRPPGVEGGDLAGAGRCVGRGGGEDLRPPGREGP
jgi:hypothetical protein